METVPIAVPSVVDVPLPSSSNKNSDSGEPFRNIDDVSVISTINVDSPLKNTSNELINSEKMGAAVYLPPQKSYQVFSRSKTARKI